VVLWAKDEKEQAVSTLTRALVLAEPEDFVRTIVDEGAAMGDLLSAVLEVRQSGRLEAASRLSTRYVAELLATLAQEGRALGASERLAEPLSERELEVLALIAAGESNREIAARLFISISTVKTHLNNLYRKHGAANRTQAVTRARDLNLLR
jgi:LuxR family transcriptional regulator, maltose regulon positive regulatory protein